MKRHRKEEKDIIKLPIYHPGAPRQLTGHQAASFVLWPREWELKGTYRVSVPLSRIADGDTETKRADVLPIPTPRTGELVD